MATRTVTAEETEVAQELLSRARQAMTALWTTHALDQPGFPQRDQNLIKIVLIDVLARMDVVTLNRAGAIALR